MSPERETVIFPERQKPSFLMVKKKQSFTVKQMLASLSKHRAADSEAAAPVIAATTHHDDGYPKP